MEGIAGIILGYLLIWKPLGYFLAFLSMIFEGEVLLLIFAFLTSQGYFNIGPMLLALLSGALLGDFLWYSLGYWVSCSSLLFPEWLHRLAHPLDRHLLDRPRRVIFISKFVYGTNKATLMRAGALRVDMGEFFKSNFYANLVWITVIGSLGYLFGASILLLKKYIRFAEIILLIIVLSFLSASHLIFKRYSEEEAGK